MKINLTIREHLTADAELDQDDIVTRTIIKTEVEAAVKKVLTLERDTIAEVARALAREEIEKWHQRDGTQTSTANPELECDG